MLADQYLGICLRKMGRLDEALVELRRSLEIVDATLVTHPGDAPALSRLVTDEREIASILAARGDSAGAIAHAQRAVSVAQKYIDGPEPGLRKRYLGDSYFGLATVDRTLNKWPEARDNAQRALAYWNLPGVTDVDPDRRDQMNAILTAPAAHLLRK
jgi:tetratricopeptide (TPR) repeat protein